MTNAQFARPEFDWCHSCAEEGDQVPAVATSVISMHAIGIELDERFARHFGFNEHGETRISQRLCERHAAAPAFQPYVADGSQTSSGIAQVVTLDYDDGRPVESHDYHL